MSSWDQRYKNGEHVNDQPHSLVKIIAAQLVPGRALDVACGPGRHALWLAAHGWRVTAVDNAPTAIQILRERAAQEGLPIDSRAADLQRGEFVIEPESYDLIVVCNYLQRDLFASIREGTPCGGCVIAAIPMVDDDPNVKPMNSAYLLNPGELRDQFKGWEFIHDFEGKPPGQPTRRAAAEIAARRR